VGRGGTIGSAGGGGAPRGPRGSVTQLLACLPG
jgi:hypothetical protein